MAGAKSEDLTLTHLSICSASEAFFHAPSKRHGGQSASSESGAVYTNGSLFLSLLGRKDWNSFSVTLLVPCPTRRRWSISLQSILHKSVTLLWRCPKPIPRLRTLHLRSSPEHP